MVDVNQTIETYKNRLTSAKTKVSNAKEIEMKCSYKLEQAEENEKKVIEKIKAQGLDPDNLKDYMSKLMMEIETILINIEKALPDKYGNVDKVAIDEIIKLEKSIIIPNPIDDDFPL